MVEGGMTCVRFLLFAFNFIFFVTGIVLIVVGALVKTNFTEYENFTSSEYTSTPVFLIVVGVIIFIIAFFGCCGAVKQSFCMTMTFAVLLGLVFVFELAAGIAAYVLKDDLKNEIGKEMSKGIDKYWEDEATRKAWDSMQHDLECCGENGSADWKNSTAGNGTIPDSCCKKEVKGCAAKEGADLWKDGCLQALESFFVDKAALLGSIGIGIAFVQVVGVVLACCLARAIKKEYEVV